MIIDTHEHCFSPKTMDCWAASRMPEFEKNNIKFIEISIDCFDIDDMIAVITKHSPCIGVVPGAHPKLITGDTDIDIVFDYVKDRLSLYRSCVLGIKTGLDYHWVKDEKAQEKQRLLLMHFLQYATEHVLPVVLHVRSNDDEPMQADEDILSILSGMKYTGKMVLHCFHGNSELVSHYLETNENTYFGIGGSITYPSCEELINAVKNMPDDRILLETDGPYIKPYYPDMSRPPGKRNSSLNLPIVIDKLSSILGMSSSELETMTAQNACEFYNLDINAI